jgi:hypothetical protein
MALAVPAEQKQAAVAAVLAGDDVEVVAKRTRIALAELARLCLAQRPDRRTRREQQRRGRKPKPGETELAVLRAIAEEKRRLTQQELAAELAAPTGVGRRPGGVHVARPTSPGRTFRTSRHNLARRRESDENPKGGVRRHFQPISLRAEAQRRTSALTLAIGGR